MEGKKPPFRVCSITIFEYHTEIVNPNINYIISFKLISHPVSTEASKSVTDFAKNPPDGSDIVLSILKGYSKKYLRGHEVRIYHENRDFSTPSPIYSGLTI